MKKYLLIAAVAFPIVALFSIMISKQMRLSQGNEVILPIAGFDPRDLLSGHYLTYRINYGSSPDCSQERGGGTELYACLYRESGSEELYRARFVSGNDLSDNECTLFIKGNCENGRFTAGIEKFYIPEQYAVPLDKAVRAGKGKIVLKVSGSGSAAIKDLLIDGKSWREYKQN